MNNPHYERYTSIQCDFMFEVDGWLVFKSCIPMTLFPWLVAHETECRRGEGVWVNEQYDRLLEDPRIPKHISERIIATLNLLPS